MITRTITTPKRDKMMWIGLTALQAKLYNLIEGLIFYVYRKVKLFRFNIISFIELNY